MGSIHDLLKDVALPRMVALRQSFDSAHLEDIEAEIRREAMHEEVLSAIRPGMSVAVTVGSRGISNIALIVREVIAFLKQRGARPFVIPAMGSHGGATAEGQLAIIAQYGITEAYVGCPVRATMEVVEIGALEDGRAIRINRLAAEADGIVSLNRIKAHTSFRATYESGVMKMLAIGLGCQAGAEVCHREGIPSLAGNVEKFAFGILKHANVIFGVGIVENAYDQTCMIRVIPGKDIPACEKELLKVAKAKMASLPFPSVDVLVVDQIGKDISGEGMDPNITGRWAAPDIHGGIDATRVAVLDLTDDTLGNFVGLGMADTCSRRVVERMSREHSYPNSLTNTVPGLCKIPMYFDTHRETLQATIKMVPAKSPDEVTLIRIPNTRDLEHIWISESLLPVAKSTPGLHILGAPQELAFDQNDDLF